MQRRPLPKLLNAAQRKQLPNETQFYITEEMLLNAGVCYSARERFREVFKVERTDKVFLTWNNYKRWKQKGWNPSWAHVRVFNRIEKACNDYYSFFTQCEYHPYGPHAAIADYRRLVALCIALHTVRRRR